MITQEWIDAMNAQEHDHEAQAGFDRELTEFIDGIVKGGPERFGIMGEGLTNLHHHTMDESRSDPSKAKLAVQVYLSLIGWIHIMEVIQDRVNAETTKG